MPGKTVPILPPSPRQHWQDLRRRPEAWLVLARNLVPVIGLYALGWSAPLAVFSYWFDGLAAMAAIIAALVPRALRETQPKPETVVERINYGLMGLFVGAVLIGVLALPYWIVLIPLHDLLLGEELRRLLQQSPALWATFGAMAALHFWRAFQVGYDQLPDQALKQRARWDMYLLVLRAIAMFTMANHGLAFAMVPLMALVLSYMEIWPGHALGLVFGDPQKLWEYDPEQGRVERERAAQEAQHRRRRNKR